MHTGFGTTTHNSRYVVTPIIGLANVRVLLVDFSFTHSFDSSFKASLMGCITPFIVVLLGPFRLCLPAIIFRSIKVKKAILKSTDTISSSEYNILDFIKGFKPFAFAFSL